MRRVRNVDTNADSNVTGQFVVVGRVLFHTTDMSTSIDGQFYTRIWTDGSGGIHKDHIDIHSDSYCINQYECLFVSFRPDMYVVPGDVASPTQLPKLHWGEYRIPSCGDLDIGAGGFSPNPDYSEFGWEDWE